mgnify:CR=1 FL=1
MAGGIGSRFWPASRRYLSKQFLDILGTGKSFIRHAFERFAPIIPAKNFHVVTNATYLQLVLEQIPELCPNRYCANPSDAIRLPASPLRPSTSKRCSPI